ncbi:MAG: sigma-70 family RNA polymerase sigma factor [Arenicellales bacterium]
MTRKTHGQEARGLDPDGELVARAQTELPFVDSAYEELMLRHERIMFQVCQRLLDRPEDAAEVVQEVMLKVYHHLVSFEGRSKFKTWLMQIVRRECFTYYKKNKQINRHTSVDEFSGIENLHTGLASSDHDKTDNQIRASQILAAIDFDDRQILTLRFIADLDLAEISEVLDLKLSATKMRLYRALDRARSIAGDQ